MQAANEGARLAEADGTTQTSVGIRVELPFEQDVNPFVDRGLRAPTFFSRLHHFVLVSDAFVVVPGGIGTVLETMMIWQLLQVRQAARHAADPGRRDVGRARRMGQDVDAHARRPLASPEDFAIPICCRTGPDDRRRPSANTTADGKRTRRPRP